MLWHKAVFCKIAETVGDLKLKKTDKPMKKKPAPACGPEKNTIMKLFLLWKRKQCHPLCSRWVGDFLFLMLSFVPFHRILGEVTRRVTMSIEFDYSIAQGSDHLFVGLSWEYIAHATGTEMGHLGFVYWRSQQIRTILPYGLQRLNSHGLRALSERHQCLRWCRHRFSISDGFLVIHWPCLME